MDEFKVATKFLMTIVSFIFAWGLLGQLKPLTNEDGHVGHRSPSKRSNVLRKILAPTLAKTTAVPPKFRPERS